MLVPDSDDDASSRPVTAALVMSLIRTCAFCAAGIEYPPTLSNSLRFRYCEARQDLFSIAACDL